MYNEKISCEHNKIIKRNRHAQYRQRLILIYYLQCSARTKEENKTGMNILYEPLKNSLT